MHASLCVSLIINTCIFQKVYGVTFDGASINRSIVKLHNSSRAEIAYKTVNPFSHDKRFVYFFQDPPHLMKTTRNCMMSKSRSMWVSWNIQT